MFIIAKKIVSGIACHFLYKVTYENLDILNQFDKCIICPNHSNIFDPAFIFPKTNHLYIIAKSEIFKNKLIERFLKHYLIYPIRREKHDISGIRSSVNLFTKNEKIKLLIFPEGGILIDNDKIRKVKNGAIYISATVNEPIIPVYITKNPKLFSNVVVRFGEPLKPNKEVLKNKDLLHRESKKLLDTIYDLSL